jgi:hypothetical protein
MPALGGHFSLRRPGLDALLQPERPQIDGMTLGFGYRF